MIFLGLVFDLNGFLWCLFLAALGARAARALSNAGRLTLWLNRTLGALFIFFAARLALADR
jgi:threonine/homoserine/homoserine lactone efflux protein